MNAPLSLGSGPFSRPKQFRAPAPPTAGVIVTGAAQRLGRAIAKDLAACGWRVVLHYRSSEQAAHSLREEIREAGGTAELLQADLSREAEASQLVDRARELVGPIGVLINNASVFELDDIWSATGESWARHMDLHLRAPILLCQSFVESLAADQGGAIINMLDSRVLNPKPKHLTYTLSKCGLWTLTRTLAQALAPRVRVNGIGPGPTLPVRGQTSAAFEQRCARLPLQRPATLDEICQAVRFLLVVQSITGQIIALDGGDHLVGHRQAAEAVGLAQA